MSTNTLRPVQPVNDSNRDFFYDAPDQGRAYQSSIGLFLTKRCPLQCSHCAVSSGPDLIDPPEENILRYAVSLAQSRAIEHVCITGGEPFLRPGLLRESARLLLDAGKEVSVITSAYWAGSPEKAKARLSDAFPQSPHPTLWLSSDAYHALHVDARHYSNAVIAASDLGIPVGLTITYTHSPDEAHERYLQLLPDEELRSRVYKLRAQPLFLIGRGASLESELSNHAGLPQGRCGSCIPHVAEDGHVTACCSEFNARADSPLLVGDLREEPIDALLEQSSTDWIVQAIRTLGPTYLARLVEEELDEDVFTRPYLNHDICSLCTQIMNSSPAVARLRSIFETDSELRLHVARLRSAFYNEDRSLDQLTGGEKKWPVASKT